MWMLIRVVSTCRLLFLPGRWRGATLGEGSAVLAIPQRGVIAGESIF